MGSFCGRGLLVSLVLLLGIGTGCRSDSASATQPRRPKNVVERIERAHGKEAWYRHRGVQATLTVEFGGARAIEGTLTFDPAVGRSRIENYDGTVMVFDGAHAWVSPGESPIPMARFHLLTWPYFMAVPFKLRDGGAHVEPADPLPLNGTLHHTARLTFSPGTGDAPDDWYLLYVDPKTSRLNAMAYVVTYGKKAGEAPDEPHVIVYDHFVTVDGVTVATDWTFRKWSREQGAHGDPIGKVTIRDLRFIDPAPDTFTKPAGAKEDPLPKR